MKAKRVALSVTELAIPAPRRGSIDVLSGLGRTAMAIGQEIHEQVQFQRARDFSNYKAEVGIRGEFRRGDYIFEVSGYMDGFFEGVPARIEEIKSTFNMKEMQKRLETKEADHPYVLQVRTYGYLHFMMTGRVPELTIHLVSSRDGDTRDLTIDLDLMGYDIWLTARLDELVEETKLAEARARRRKRVAEGIAFPFAAPRAGQRELISLIEEAAVDEKRLLIQAPTGLGKTVGVLYPTLKEALARGQRLIYVTPKNSQHGIAEHALKLLRENQGGERNVIKSMTLSAKSKMCFKSEALCNPEFCEFAKDHYTKVTENKLVAELAKKRSLTSKTIRKVARENEVCPYELQIEASRFADVVVCDYNYVFAPRSKLDSLSGRDLGQNGQPNLVIDEAHNLPSRAMDYFSPELSVEALQRWRDDGVRLPERFRADFQLLVDQAIEVVRACGTELAANGTRGRFGLEGLITPPIEAFVNHEGELKSFLAQYLKSDVEIEARDPVLRLTFYWSEFTQALEWVSGKHPEFFTTFRDSPARVRITCCDASAMLKESYDDYKQVVAFSATLKPFNFYGQLSGLEGEKLKLAEFASPFAKENRKVLIIPQISSKYATRDRNAPKIADAIARIAAVKPGNYFAFFPSFDFMQKVLAVFQAPVGFETIRQERSMNRDDVKAVLARLTAPHPSHILFAVQGGVFSEGIDYPGEMAIGAFIIGPPLPTFDLEREKMRDYYEVRHSSGYNYAYVYPAMAKAVQAAGRVIRTETDRGLIVLMDDRFTQSSYASAMPSDWFTETPRELISGAILREVEEFWDSENS